MAEQLTLRLAVTTAMTTCAYGNGRYRYPFHVDYAVQPAPVAPAAAQPDATTLRLAVIGTGREEGTFKDSPMPTVRLACAGGSGTRDDTLSYEPDVLSPTVRLACVGGAQGEQNGSLDGGHGGLKLGGGYPDAPALLTSFVYLKAFQKTRPKYHFRDWVLDSGAFSAHSLGVHIDLSEYIDTCRQLLATDPHLTEVFALDVIGDWRASLRNTEAMWKAGVPAIPCYHVGEPEDVLLGIARDYPKIALGGAVGFRGKGEWAAQCFARVWPKRIHGFGFGGEKDIMALPWHSVDATNWEIGPCKFGRWASLGAVSIRGSKQNLRGEVKHYLDIEKRARAKWAGAMAQLPPLTRPTFPSPATPTESTP